VTIEQLVPRVGAIEVADLLSRLRGAPRGRAGPFDGSRIDFSDAISRAIFRHPRSRAFPELIAVAFWLRRAAVLRLADRFAALEHPGSLRVPRGLAFHVPPTNVDTVFVYSLVASFLVGNVNLVRVSPSKPSEQVAVFCELLRELLAEDQFAAFGDELAVVSYAHESEPTAMASQEADVRLLWGGDDTIDRLRAVPPRPGAHDLTFGDRFSFAVLRPEAVLDADDPSRHELAERLFNDAYWFDQLACSSPRLLVWVGAREDVDGARRLLFADLSRVISDKGYALGPGASVSKLTFLYGALIDRPIEGVYRAGTELVVLSLSDLAGFDRTHPGGGLFFEGRVEALADLAGFVTRKDQTLTAHGFSYDELTTFARSLQGRGIDRIVQFGDALSFSTLWDGYDLLAELTRTVGIAAPA
jgi:Acyl-CoA reductase (LuxC)